MNDRAIQTIALRTSRGRPLPLGATAVKDCVNFALLCRHGTRVVLVISPIESNVPLAEIELHPRRNRTGDHWHVLVQDLPTAFRFGYRVDGPKGPLHRYDPNVVLLDPAATLVSDGGTWGSMCEVNPQRSIRRCMYVRAPRYDWKDDQPPLTPLEDSIIYELHVRGFTCHPSSGVAHPGTFAGLVEKIAYLKELGMTAVELLALHEFDDWDGPVTTPLVVERLCKYLG